MKSHSKSDLKPGEHQIIQTEGKPVWKVLKGAPVSSCPNHSETRKLFAFLKWAYDREYAIHDIGKPLRIFFSNNIFTPEICLKMVKFNGFLLEVIPKKFWTKKMLKVCFKYRTLSLKGLPARFKTKEMCQHAIDSNLSELRHIPESARWRKDLLLRNLRRWPKTLCYIPQEDLTVARCASAVKKDLNLISYLPKHLREEVENQLKGIKK